MRLRSAAICILCGAGVSLRAAGREYTPPYSADTVRPAAPGGEVGGRARVPGAVSLWTASGAVLGTNKYVSKNGGPKAYSSVAVKWAIPTASERWEDAAYGMPYGGVGLYAASFHGASRGNMGTPMSLFLFQGATLARVSPRMELKYEWDLGLSFGWKHYDPFDNPLNVAIGSSVNVHVAVNLFLNWYAGRYYDLNFGMNATHFSNGASRLPNAGLNLVAPTVELCVNFNPPEARHGQIYAAAPPPFTRRVDHDLSLTISARQTSFVADEKTGLPLPYIDRKFKVLGLNYAMLMANNYKYKWGPAADVTYDESSGVRAWREPLPDSGQLYERVRLGPMGKRLSLGVGMHGELTMMHYSVFATVGYNLLWGNRGDTRLYQVLGLKAYLSRNLFGTFGIRASRFSSAQYLYWSLGYTIAGGRK